MESYQALAISLGLGLLVGLQRQWKQSEIAGIRTFPLISLLGTLSVLASGGEVTWISGIGLLAVAVMLTVANLAKIRNGELDFGMTTEVAALLMYVVGCTLGTGLNGPAIVTAGAAAVLLHWKDRLHGIVSSMESKDLMAVMNLALVALVILPVLPDQTYGPYDVLNPHDVWRMVVLIVGISLAAYVGFQLVGAKAGALLGGVLGGLISSTATTVSYARQSKDTPNVSGLAALVILIASAVVNLRVLFEVAVVAPGLLKITLFPMLLLFVLMLLECVVLYFPLRAVAAEPPKYDNPAQLQPAVIFGLLYAVILFVVAAAKELFGDQALYWIAGISGLTDVDAITLSTAKMFNENRVDGETAWRVILIATMSNLVFKVGAVALLGTRRLLVYVASTFAIAIAGGGAILAFWPSAAHSGELLQRITETAVSMFQ